MKITSILFYKKFDYVVFSIGLSTFLMIIVDLFYITNLNASMLWDQLSMVFIYYLVTRERAERNFIMKGIEPIIVLSFFGFLVMLSFLVNVIVLLDLIS